VLTPEQRAGANGQIPNPNAQEYYLGQINPGDFTSGDIVGAVSGTLPSLAWYKYVSDGTTPVVFDLFGSNFGFSFGGFSGGPDGELAVYDVNGRFVAGNEGAKGPANGDSNLPPLVPDGAPPAPVNFRQPRDPRRPVYEYTGTQWLARNNQGLSHLAFVSSPQANPIWDPQHPNHVANADWSQYALLPAGTYFLAVTGYSTYFAGNPRDIGTAGTDTDSPFGFVSFHAMGGVYVLNARRGGDLDLSGSANSDDVAALIARIRSLAPQRGIAPSGFFEDDWIGLPSDLSDANSELQRFDLTSNSRIDLYDVGALGRYSGLAVPVFSQWAISGGGAWSSTATGNWSGNGVPNGIDHAASFGTLNGSINAPQTVALSAPVTVGAINFDNSATYTISAAPGATITLNVSLSPDAQLNVFDGSHTIDAPIVALQNTTVQVLPDNGLLNLTGKFTASGKTITKLGAGVLQVGSIHSGSLSVAGGSVKISKKPAANSAAGTSIVQSLTIELSSQLDLTNNSLILDYSGPAGSLIDDARQHLLANRITTSSAAAGQTALGYGDNGLLNKITFSGQPVDTSSVLIKFTYLGDTDLDGDVDVADLGSLASNWQTTGVWTGGDFDYNGFIDVADLGLLASNWQAGAVSPLAPDLATALAGLGLSGIPVPEPCLWHFSLSAITLVRRRRRRS
jgi:hypothetical protein